MAAGPSISLERGAYENPPFARMAAEQRPRWFARQMDFDRWKRDIKAMGKQLPSMDTLTSTALGIAIAFGLAWIGEDRSASPDDLQRNFYGLGAVFAAFVTAGFYLRNKQDRDRLVDEAERICKDIEDCVEEWKENGNP